MDESARQLKRLAHISRFVRIHIGIGQRCYAIDAESSTLPGKASAALVTFQRGDGTLHMWGSIRGKIHRLPRNARSNGQHFSGALEDGSKSERTYFALFWYTFELVSVASPPE